MKSNNYSERLVIAAHQKIKEKNYWLKKLSGNPPKTNFPYDYKKNDTGECSIDEVKFEITGNEFSWLIQLSNKSDTRLFMILATQLVILLEKYTGQKDITFGAPIYQQHIKADFINTVLILRNKLESNMTFKELLLQVRDTLTQAAENYSYPIKILADQLNIPFTKRGFSLFDIVILLKNIHEKSYIRDIETNMILSFLKTGASLKGIIQYNSLLYRKSTIERISSHFKQLVKQTSLNPDSPAVGIEILSPQEKKQLLVDFNNTTSGYPRDKTIQELFQEQVGKTPHRIALVFEDKALTYGKLNKQANQLAHTLRREGVNQDHLLGIMLERSLDMVVGILGVLKSGGGYLPIDPEFPKNRIVTMLEDCQADILITAAPVVKKHTFTGLLDLQSSQEEPHVTDLRPQITDFDHLPIPDRSLVDYEKYNQYLGQAIVKDSISIQATRGCPYQCIYCHKIWPKNHIRRSAENIFAEVQLYYNMGVRRFAIIDDIFNLDRKESQRFFQLIIENQLRIHIFFPNGLRGDILTKDYIDLMIKAGTINIGLALETASPRLQQLIRKNLDLENFRDNIQYISEKYPHIITDLFTMHGYPSETEEEARLTMDFIKNLKWIHFPYVFVLKIYPNTEMEKLALAQGISRETIMASQDLLFQELPDTLPFNKSFTLKYQAEFTSEYFLSKERLLHVLPHQVKILTEDELVRKYNSYLPVDIKCLDDLLEFVGIGRQELNLEDLLGEQDMQAPDLNQKMKKAFGVKKSSQNALRVLLMDLSQNFSQEGEPFGDHVEPPIGLMYLLTYLNQQLGRNVKGKIVKSMIDFDNYLELKLLLDEFKPDVIGIRTLTFYKNFFHKTVAMIRQWGIKVPIISGGPYATSSYTTLLQDRNVDLVVLGEGEITFCEVIKKIHENGKKLPNEEVLKDIKGITFVPQKEDPRKKFARQIFFLDELTPVLAAESAENPGSINQSSHLAYCMYTSGSTGKPKGTLTNHYNVVRLVRNTNYIELKENDRILQLSNYAFDGSVFDIYGALLNGAALVMMKKEDLFALDKAADLIKREEITLFFVTTALFNTLVNLKIDGFAGVRKILFGGEQVSVEHVKKAREYLGKDRIIHVYGPTETTVYATHYLVRHMEDRCGTIPIGKPISNTSIYILDKNLKPVPINAIGEIYIGQDGVARGYLNDPLLTAEKFMVNPFDHQDRLYKTGDLARWLVNGNIEFIGRVDDQVKIRGFRIEMEEIEKHLLNHKNVNEAIVLAHESPNRDQRYLCAYVALKLPDLESKNEFDISQLRRFLERELPDYMIPSYFMIMEKIPLTANGKIDKKALPEPEVEIGDYAAPRDHLEKTLTEIWQEVMGLKQVGIKDNLFEIGGDSIKAIQILARMKKYKLKAEARDLFLYPTIEELVKHVKQTDQLIHQGTVVGEIPPTPIIKWFYQNNFFGSHHLNHSVMIYRQQGFDERILEKVFTAITAHHDALRIVYQTKNNTLLLRNRGIEEKLFDFNVIHMEEETHEEDKIKITANKIQREINLKEGPLIKLALFKTAQGDHLLVVIHHLVVDGISWRILLEDFSTAYRQVEKGEEIKLQEKTHSFKHWAEKLKEYSETSEALAELGYWQSLEETKIEKLPKKQGIPMQKKTNRESETLVIRLDTQKTKALIKEANKAYNTEVNDILLTALGRAIKEWCGINQIVISLEGHGREPIFDSLDISRTVGWFTALYPVLLDMSQSEQLSYQLKSVKETLRRIPNKGIGYGILKYLTPMDKKQGAAFNLQPEISFNYLGEFGQETNAFETFQLSPLDMGDTISPDMERTYVIVINGMVVEQQLVISFNYCKHEYEPTAIEELAKYYQANLIHLIELCTQKEEKELTPSDVGYNEISIEELQHIENYINENL